MPQLDATTFAPQLIWLAITFTALYFMLSRILLPRVKDVIEERRDRIQRDLDEAERLNQEMKEALASYEQALAQARSKASGIAAETRKDVTEAIERKQAEVEAQLSAQAAEAEARIAASKAEAMQSVRSIGAETASSLVEQLTGTAPAPDAVDAAMGNAG